MQFRIVGFMEVKVKVMSSSGGRGYEGGWGYGSAPTIDGGGPESGFPVPSLENPLPADQLAKGLWAMSIQAGCRCKIKSIGHEYIYHCMSSHPYWQGHTRTFDVLETLLVSCGRRSSRETNHRALPGYLDVYSTPRQ